MRSKAWHDLTRRVWPFDRHPDVADAFDRAAARLEAERSCDLLRFFAWLAPRYARWTDDVPGSERYHHARPFGLLIHSAEAVERAVAVGIATSPGLPTEWVQATIAFALFHDCGRLLDIHASGPDGRVWDPFETSLLDFCRDAKVTWRWKPGRGLDRHEYISHDLFPSFLPQQAFDPLLPLLKDAWYGYVSRDWAGPDSVGSYAWCAAGIVAWADQRSAEDDRFARKWAARSSPTARVDAPVYYYQPKPPGSSRSPETR